MKKTNWKIALGSILLLLSVAFYGLHYLLFHDGALAARIAGTT